MEMPAGVSEILSSPIQIVQFKEFAIKEVGELVEATNVKVLIEKRTNTKYRTWDSIEIEKAYTSL